MAGGLRFSLFGSLGDAVRPLWRVPAALALLVLPMMLITGVAAAVEALYASGPGLWPWLGRAANRAFFVGIDVTIGSAVVLVALAALDGTAIDWRRIVRQSRLALPVVVPMSLLGTAVWHYAVLFIFQPVTGESPLSYVVYPMVELVALILSVLIAVTWGQATFAALTGSPFRKAFGRAWALARRARWKLGLLAFLMWLADNIISDLGNWLTTLMVGTHRPVLHDGVSQAIYILWYVLTMLILAAVGRRLAQVEATRNPDLLADTFD